jgi:hypothetical protein
MTAFSDYTSYYTRTITRNVTGYKPVPGGTGNGKTSAIPNVVKAETTGRQYLYVANRIQLLDEMAAKLRETGVPFIHLRRDVDLVVEMLKNVAHRENLEQLLRTPTVVTGLNTLHQSTNGALGLPAIRHAIVRIEQILPFVTAQSTNGLSDLIEDPARVLMHTLQRLLRDLAREATGEDRPKAHRQLTAHPAIRHLFPYIAFRETKTPILLVTLQKLFHGCFDGRTMVNLSQLKDTNGGYVVFLDEFDFLESNLIELICADAEIVAPFKFVASFYEAMTRHKLPLPDYPAPNPRIRARIEQIINDIDALREAGLTFPAINQFTCSSATLKGQAIFQTTRTVTNRSLYLRQTERSFAVVAPDQLGADERGLPAFVLFRAVTTAMRRILILFKDLEISDPIVYREMLRHCFDYTIFARSLGRIRQVPQRHQAQSTQFGQLLDSGYNLYEIHDLQQTSDRDEVDFRHFAINTTPEKLLLQLTTHNLVFGLSATADIPRCVRSFSEEWLREQEGFRVIALDAEDEALLAAINTAKQQIRANDVQVVQAGDLDEHQVGGRELRQLIDAIAIEEEFGGDDDGGYRRGRAAAFLATLQWIIQRGSLPEGIPDTHLLFFNSFRQIRALCVRPQASGVFTTRPWGSEDGERFDAHEVTFGGQRFLVLFYDAQQGQAINTNLVAEQRYARLFWEGVPVLVVTTYPSAGNGVNVQYRPTPDATSTADFTHLHLLEAPYFYFGQVSRDQTDDQQTALIKQNFWYLAKLFESKLLSPDRFRRYLANIRYAGLSQEYRDNVSTARDALLNRLATYIQALGRIERAWVKMPDQVVRCGREVYNDLVLFCTGEAYADVFESRRTRNSPNLERIWAAIQTMEGRRKAVIERTRDERLAGVNQRCREALNLLVERLDRFRHGQDTQAKALWQALREAVLKRDLHAPVLKQYHCLFHTPYADRGVLYIDEDLTIYRPDAAPPESRSWHLNAVYTRLRRNETIQRYFAQRGYELGITTLAQTFLTPACYQSILVGALGEQAAAALLNHERIPLEEPPDALFETADMRIAGQPWYIDAKFYSQRTLDGFLMPLDDPDWTPKLNEEDFQRLAREKLAYIQAHHASEAEACKLIYLNLASANDRARRYLSASGEPVATLAEAQLVIIQGMMDARQPDSYTNAFQTLLADLRSLLHRPEGA